MNPEHIVHATQYFRATIYEWQALLGNDNHKDIIIDSLQFLVNDKRIELNAFVIMSNHIHLIW
jgi:putative transposase